MQSFYSNTYACCLSPCHQQMRWFLQRDDGCGSLAFFPISSKKEICSTDRSELAMLTSMNRFREALLQCSNSCGKQIMMIKITREGGEEDCEEESTDDDVMHCHTHVGFGVKEVCDLVIKQHPWGQQVDIQMAETDEDMDRAMARMMISPE